MKYNKIVDESPLYEYGEGKEFKTREEALNKAQKEAEKTVITNSAMLKIYEYLTKKEIVEKDNAFQVVAIFEVPSVFQSIK